MESSNEFVVMLVVEQHKQRGGWADLESKIATLSRSCRDFVNSERTSVCIDMNRFRESGAKGALASFLARCPRVQTVFANSVTPLTPREVKVVMDACPQIQELMAPVDCRAFSMVTNRFFHLHLSVPSFLGGKRYDLGNCPRLKSLYISIENAALCNRVRELIHACDNLESVSIDALHGYIHSLPVILDGTKVTGLRLYGKMHVTRGTCPQVKTLYIDGSLEDADGALVLQCFHNAESIHASNSVLRVPPAATSMVSTVECISLEARPNSSLPRLRSLNVHSILSMKAAVDLSRAAPALSNLRIVSQVRATNPATHFLSNPDVVESIFRQLLTYTVVCERSIIVGGITCIEKLSFVCSTAMFLGETYPSLKTLNISAVCIQSAVVNSFAGLKMLAVCQRLRDLGELFSVVSKSPRLQAVILIGMPWERTQEACQGVCKLWGISEAPMPRRGNNLNVTLHRDLESGRALLSYAYLPL